MRVRPIREGLLIGLLAYAAVAVFYAGFDLLASRGAWFTVNMLGSAVLYGLRDPGVLQYPVELNLAAIFGYNAIHFFLSLGIGITVVALVDQAERFPERRRAVLFVIVAGFFVTILAVGFLSRPIRPVLPWWSIVAANSAAVVIAGAYLLRKHPGVVARLFAPAGAPQRAFDRSRMAPHPPSRRQ